MREIYEKLIRSHKIHAQLSPYFNLFFNFKKIRWNFPEPNELKSPESIDKALNELLAAFPEYICNIGSYYEHIIKFWKKRLKNSDTSHFLDEPTKQKLLELPVKEIKIQDLGKALHVDFLFFRRLLKPIIELIEMKDVNVSYLTSEGFKFREERNIYSHVHLIHALAMYTGILDDKDHKSALDCYVRLIRKDITLLKLIGKINLADVAEFFGATLHTPECTDVRYHTPLHIAAAVNNTEIIKWTVNFCPESINYICNSEAPSPIGTALSYGQFKSVDTLQESGAHFDPYGFFVGLNIIFLEKYTFSQKRSTYLSLQAWLKQPLLLESDSTKHSCYRRIDEIASELIRISLYTDEGNPPIVIKPRNRKAVINLFSSFLARQISFPTIKEDKEYKPERFPCNQFEQARKMVILALEKLYSQLIDTIAAETKFVPKLNGIIIDYLLDYKVANPLLPEGVSLKRAGNKFEFFAEIAQPPATACTDSTDMGKGGTKRKLAQPEGSVSRQKIA
jgi:hypothetical protein